MDGWMDESVPFRKDGVNVPVSVKSWNAGFMYVIRGNQLCKVGEGSLQGRQPRMRGPCLVVNVPPCPSRGTLSLRLQFLGAGSPGEQKSKPITHRRSLQIG